MKPIQLFLLTLLLILCRTPAQAQFTVTGTLADTSGIDDVNNISVVIIRASDSILQSFTRTDIKGNFSLDIKDTGTYLMLATHPSFATYIESFRVKDRTTALGILPVISRSELLETIFFTDARAIMVKGDTTIYIADSFNVRQYATVDELLKKLPGLEVSRDGKIKAYGKDVQRMYVDGEEFFSDDPSVVAKTLQASSIDRVKVYEDKSENSRNTGVDDGERVTTINLTLKENAKKGVMGSLEAGYGHPDFYELAGKVQSYKGKRKVAAYIMGANTNNNTLGFRDRQNYAGDEGFVSFDENTGISTYMSEGPDNSGLPRNINGGFNYTNKLLEDKLSVNATYGYNNHQLEKMNNSISRYIMPDTQYVITNNSTGSNHNITHKASTTETVKFDSLKTLTFTGSMNVRQEMNTRSNSSESKDILDNLITSTTSKNTTENKSLSSNLRIYYNQKLRKEGRSYSVAFNFRHSDVRSEGSLNSLNRLILLDSNIVYNQLRDNRSLTLNYGGSLTYTEPLLKDKVFLELSYNFARNENNNDFRTYDYDASGTYYYNPLFSNVYAFNYNSQTGGFNLRYNHKKIRSSVGLSANDIRFEQVNELHSGLSRTYGNFNLMPRASVNYKLNSGSNFTMNYNGRTQQPTIEQIQPLVINTDPTNIRLGNENLRQSFNNSLSLTYNTYSVLKNYYAYVSGNMALNINPISQAQTLNESGIRTYQHINTRNSSSYSLWAMYNKGVTDDLDISGYFSTSYGTNYSLNNNQESRNNTLTFSPGLGIEYDLDTILEISLRFTPTYYNATTSLRTDVKNDYWTYATYLDFSYLLPLGLEVESRVDWQYRPRVDNSIRGNNVWLWNAGLSKTLLKDRSLKVTLYCYDILNQNVGFNYYQSGYNVNESSWNVVQRYLMLKAQWNFNSQRKPRPAAGAVTE